VIFLLAAGLVTVFLYSVIPAMVHQFQALVHDFPGYVANLQGRSARFRELTDRFHLTGKVQDLLAALLTTDLWPTTVIVALFFVGYQQLENYVIAPRILRHTVSLSAAAVLLAGLIGGTVLGLIGALMAIPVAAGLKVVLAEQLRARDSADADAEAGLGSAGPGERDTGHPGS